MKRIKFFSDGYAKCLIAGKVSEVVVSDDMTIVFNNNKFWYKKNGDEYDCEVPHNYIAEDDYDAIAKYIRVNAIIPHIDFDGDVVALSTVPSSTISALMSGELEKYDIEFFVREDFRHATSYCKFGELFVDEGVFVFRVFDTDYEFEISLNVHESLFEIINLTFPVASNWGDYLSLGEYICCAWSKNNFNFEITDVYGNTWYSCNKDADGNRLPIMDWYVGKKNTDLKVAIGDVRSSYYALINEGGIVDTIITKLLFKYWGVE